MKKPIQKERKIVRRPKIMCQITNYDAGLLRMTVSNPCSHLNLTPMGFRRNSKNKMQQYCIDIENASIKNRKKLAEKSRALARSVIIWYLMK